MTDLSKLTVDTIISDASNELIQLRKEGKPLVVSYKVPCPCSSKTCDISYCLTITPYTDAVYSRDGSRRFQ